MPLVNVMVNGRAYTIACDDGEEDHLKELATHVDSKVQELLSSVGQVGEVRLLLMAALLLADEHHGLATKLDALIAEVVELKKSRAEIMAQLNRSESLAADALENAAKKVEDIVAGLGPH